MPPAPEPSERLAGNESPRPSRSPAVVLRASPPSVLAIFCGAQELITWENILESDYDEHRPGIIQILPETLSFVSPSIYKEARTTRSNGCGAPVHGAVSLPCQSRTLNRLQCWYGAEENLAETVVPLERIGNPLGAVQTHCSTHSFRGSTAPPKSSTSSDPPPSRPHPPHCLKSHIQMPPASGSSTSAVEPAPLAMPLPPAPPSAVNLFSSEFIQSVANGLDEFVDVGVRGDADLNPERDSAQWFNPDDVGVPAG
ncbi:hypothetical protein K438DRAFT_1873899 [Mycena galopus ATCC 62051]|nr:hypothetical protein K438DRAFT_1873899 [Mycena galopus ATCC 62051]